MTSARDAFAATLPFPLDRFQAEAIDALVERRSVLVAAPTGAGKTVVGEFALWHALQQGTRAFYTTPIKALSNQKFHDLCGLHGPENVGLLTGDNVINGDAPLVVMTTEVLRNMIYERSPALHLLTFVVLDEVHYLADVERGAVWEEVIIQLSPAVQIAALSATVSNAEEFGAWMAQVRAHAEAPGAGCDVVISELRPVPLEHHYAINHTIYPVFRSGSKGQGGRRTEADAQAQARQARRGRPNPEVVMLERRAGQRNRVTGRGRRVGGGDKLRPPRRGDLVRMLAERRWLPAIVFVFSRQGCDDAVGHALSAGVRLTTAQERASIAEIAERHTSGLADADLRVLGYARWLADLQAGVAAHHAGMIPAFKEAVEEAFAAGLIKVVFATETLALGINMPARTVVIERLEKWNGTRHEMLTPGQFTQLTGRAGRRGKDQVGHAVVTYQRDVEFEQVAGLVARRTEPLVSRFAPSYNMAVNLLRRMEVADAVALLERSFAQYQADSQVAGTSQEISRNRAALEGYAQHLVSDVGDFDEYWALRREISRIESATAKSRRERRTEAIEDAIDALVPGDVIVIDGGRRAATQRAAVVERQRSKAGTPLATVVGEDRRSTRLGPREFDRPPLPVGSIRLPQGHHRQPRFRKDVVSRLLDVTPRGDARGPDVTVDVDAAERVAELRRRMTAHPVHSDPALPEIEVWAHRYDDLKRGTDRLERSIRRRTTTLVTRFHAIVALLQRLGYLDGAPAPTDDGIRLARIYGQTDLVLAECLRWGSFDGLDPAEFSAALSVLVFESRGDEPGGYLPTARLHEAVADIEGTHARVVAMEAEHALPPTRPPDASFAAIAYRWAAGADLDGALAGAELTPGDFVRAIKLLADTVRQVRDVADASLRATAAEANRALVRGVVTR